MLDGGPMMEVVSLVIWALIGSFLAVLIVKTVLMLRGRDDD